MIDRESRPVHIFADGKAGARILLDESSVPGLKEVALSELVILPGAKMPQHSHDKAAEVIYILSGRGSMVLDKKRSMVRAGMAIYIPAGMAHSFSLETKVEPMRVLQVYTPGGPEQRFRKGRQVKE